MASNSGTRKKSAGAAKASSGGSKRASSQSRTASKRVRTEEEKKIGKELLLLLMFAAVILLFLCNFGVIGPVGDALSSVLFGIFGIMAYAAPIIIFLLVSFGISNQGNPLAMLKLAAIVVVLLSLMAMAQFIWTDMGALEGSAPITFYRLGADERKGGGILGGSFAWLLYSLLDTLGSIIILLVLLLASLVILTGKSLVSGMKRRGGNMLHSAREDVVQYREKNRVRRAEQEEQRLRKEEEERSLREQQALHEEREEAEKILRMDKKVSGVMLDTKLKKEISHQEEFRHDDIHEITLRDMEQQEDTVLREELPLKEQKVLQKPKPISSPKAEVKGETKVEVFDFDQVRIHGAHQIELEELTPDRIEIEKEKNEPVVPFRERPQAQIKKESTKSREEFPAPGTPGGRESPRPYQFPPISCLAKMNPTKQEGTGQLKETAMRLQQTLATFGVRVTITDISQGPSVTRYELQPEQGVKVSKIVGLADDIKLNLAATDIRIEAPIPGKAAVGIEVPNKENAAVGLRELLESKEYKEFPSRLAFAVGKDIAGKVVVADIAKMPHMLIAGATGSGKSVCINTLIMSLLYKARPDEVKLIMIDPKVVELSVYNGIPHLLIPVVTDPKKAAGALHWGVAEMTDRYQRFADFNVRDLKGYNAEIDNRIARGDQDVPAKMPQIVIIVDELADLMMVAPGEVEESICRLAQLARAAGIHLIIATQRPSVDVITGLIKANMPSRVAFAVSSGVDSRTILDMNGAEKLLGKGDMLFYPQGYPKPARMQGAFISDREVGDVVDFLKNQTLGNVYNEDIEDKIKSIGSSSGGGSSGMDSERDSYFEEAGRFIIDKDKASIGMLQRVFKIGFNRAARIMDQLADAGVVGEEEGTKPRKVLMSMEQFETYIEEVL
ncbi:MAG: DNA translocase FtsK [Lachnospiraceae bacterium]|nr:DNA translocase FtsK [Lachnospiraceae bacterium]